MAYTVGAIPTAAEAVAILCRVRFGVLTRGGGGGGGGRVVDVLTGAARKKGRDAPHGVMREVNDLGLGLSRGRTVNNKVYLFYKNLM